ncbi:MAG: outer membrane protein W [Glaciecola sp.]|jgi:outer membrane protein W
MVDKKWLVNTSIRWIDSDNQANFNPNVAQRRDE